ncbi:hypothetical protein EDC01DRAFT_598981, partial [Geopyxis carbonaria]
IAPIFLKSLLPKEDYDGFCLLIDTLDLLTSFHTNENDLAKVKRKLTLFSIYYEDRFYHRSYDRVRVCLPIFHQMIHIPDALKWTGPLYVYAQWCMERI